jgi:putative CocE/NonD family hydrolase
LPRLRVVSAAFLCLVSPVLPAAAPHRARSFSSAPAAAGAQAAQPDAARLQSLSGEFSDPAEPEIRYSFYAAKGGLTIESDRVVPTLLTAISSTEFAFPETQTQVHFTLDATGRAQSFRFSTEPGTVYERTGPAVKLHAVILRPADIAAPLPFLMQRTPYGVDGTSRAEFFAERPELARDGYIYVAEDIRGRYRSQGKFVMMRPLADHSDPRNIDESTDAYDTVAWLLKNIPGNNGRVGVVGTSYPGFLAMMAGIDPHPAVKAISPQAPMIDVWLGDDFFHNGAFRQSYGYDYVLSMESSRRFTSDSYGKTPDGEPADGYDFFLRRGSFLQDVKQSGSKALPTWKLFLDHPAYDAAWRSRGVEYHLNTVAVPTLTVGGYYDQEDMWGPQEEYKELEAHDTGHNNFFVEGPWRHGYWSSSSAHLGNLQYGEPIGSEFRRDIEAKFFAHYLKGAPGFTLENTASFETGSNRWQYYARFPPAEARSVRLHLAGNGALSWSLPAAQAAASYISDPANPVPYRHRPIQPTYGRDSQWYNWMTEDQRFVTDRRDVAVFRLPVLNHDLRITGEVIADIFASTTGSDNDMVVKLIDGYPEDDPDPAMRGYELMTNAEIFRGRYLSGFDRPAALAPGSIREYRFSLHDVDHVFRAGHTVMVEIQSTWFPLYDRNPQTFVPNIMKARPEDYRPAAITLYSGADHDSAIELPVIGPPATGR